MAEMKCYKCGSEEELSKKTKHLMICKPCRRQAYKPPVKECWNFMDEWNTLAWARYFELSAKYDV